MDLESRFLLYLVALGSLVGLGAVVARRQKDLRVHALHLGTLLVLALAVLAWPERIGRAAPWVAAAYALVAVLPWLALTAAGAARSRRRFSAASRWTTLAAALLGGAQSIRREAALLRAFAAADAGDAETCRAVLSRLAAAGGLSGVEGGDALVRIVPAAAARRWDEVLRAVEESPTRGPAVLLAECRASAESGDVARALRAADSLADYLRPGSHPLAAARRSALAAAGRAPFLEDARRRGLPVAAGVRGEAEVAVARALEARGDVEGAAQAFEAALPRCRGAVRRDAEAGRERCRGGTPLVAVLDERTTAGVLDLEARCRVEPPDEGRRPLPRLAPATFALAAATAVLSATALLLLGSDLRSLVAAGALSATLVAEGEVWRLGSAVFLHAGWTHLALNVATVLWAGVPYEARTGPARTVVAFLGSGFAGSAASAFLGGTEIGVGASGAALGLLGAWFVLVLRRRTPLDAGERRFWLVVTLAGIAGTAVIGALESGAVDNVAHGAGFCAGALLGLLTGSPERPAGARDGGRDGVPSGGTETLRRGTRFLGAAALSLAAFLCVAAAVLQAPRWFGSASDVTAGVRVEIPSWLRGRFRLEGTDVAVARREPLPFVLRVSSRDDDPFDVRTLLPEIDPAAAGPGGEAWREVVEMSTFDPALGVEVEDLRFASAAPGAAIPVRVVTFRRGGVSATVVLPDGEEGDSAFGDDVDRIGRTLAAHGDAK